MTTPPPDQPRWQQPDWTEATPAEEADPILNPPPAPPLSGSIIVPRTPTPPPSVLESTLNVVTGVIWPAAIALAIFGYGGWVSNILIAIVASALFGGIAGEMKKRRRHQ